MDRERVRRNAKRSQVTISVVLVSVYAILIVLALAHGNWVIAGVIAPFLIVATVMLRQRMRTGEPISFLTTIVQLFGRRHGNE